VFSDCPSDRALITHIFTPMHGYTWIKSRVGPSNWRVDGVTLGQPRRRQLFAPERIPEFLMTETGNVRRYVTRDCSRTAGISVDAHGKPALRSKP
jgi:hypothetical protein